MHPKYYGLIEMLVSLGLVVAFAAQQLWSLRDRKPPGEDPQAPMGD